jgi:hypothetical protein
LDLEKKSEFTSIEVGLKKSDAINNPDSFEEEWRQQS